jgi:hypothetical protein
MNLVKRRPSWRGAAVAGVAGLALLAPVVAWTATAANAGTRAAQVAQCGDTSTYVWLADAPNGATGHIGYPIEFTNTGARSCWLGGFPGVQGVTGSGHALGPAAGRYSLSGHRVTIKPDQTAHAELVITDKGFISGCHQGTGAGLAVYPPNQRQRQLVLNFTFPACKNKAYMSVLPVQPGIGVP